MLSRMIRGRIAKVNEAILWKTLVLLTYRDLHTFYRGTEDLELMAIIGPREMVEQVLGVLSEAFEGPRESWSYFTDTGKDGGLFGTLEKLDAQVASRILGRTSIAAHVNHVIFGLHASARWIEGDRTTRKWDESWSVSSVDRETWTHTKERLRVAYKDMRRVVELFTVESEEAMAGALGALAHVAYHLGAIRQKVSFAAVR
jgi:hypothetical protein